MPFALPKLSPPRIIDLEEFPLEKLDLEWLKKKLPKKPTIDDVNQLANRLSKAAPNDSEERRHLSVLIGVQESLKGNFVARGTRVVGAKGVQKLSEVHVLALTGARPVNGESEKMRSVKERMETYLIGQAPLKQEFADFYAATQAPGRRVPPVMVMVGPDGHGKAQAVEGFADATSGGRVHHVDMFGLTDRDAPGIFDGPGAPLAIDTLKDLAEEGGVVWITGMESVNAPKIAAGLAKRINAQKGSPGYVKLPWFLDYTVEPEQMSDDPRHDIANLIGRTLDAAGLRAKANQVVFERLTPEAMLIYAENQLAQMMAAEGLDGITLVFDPDARKLLGDLLATPYKPLNELEARLRELIVRKFDTQTSVYRKGGFIRVSLGKPFQDNADLRNNLAGRFKEKHVDLEPGAVAFELLETGRIVESDNLAQGLIDDARAYAHLIRGLGDEIRQGTSLKRAQDLEKASAGMGRLFQEVAKHLQTTAAARMKTGERPLDPALFTRLEREAKAFSSAVSLVQSDPLLAVPAHVSDAVRLRQEIYAIVDLVAAGGELEAEQLPLAAEVAEQFGSALASLAAKMNEANPQRKLENLYAGLEALASVVDMAHLAAKDNAQNEQIDIIRREDAKACRQALEEVRQILVAFSLESALQFKSLDARMVAAGYDPKTPTSIRLVDVARDLIDSMQGEEDVNARDRADLAIRALREHVSEVAELRSRSRTTTRKEVGDGSQNEQA